MCALFRNRYLIGSKRYKGYDYSSPGGYFITICTKNKIPYFGNIENGQMLFSELGRIAMDEWLKTPSFRPEMNISLDNFVIMPDHFHAIIIIGRNATCGVCCRNAMRGVSTDAMRGVSTYMNEFAPQSNNLSSIVRGFKSAVTTYAKKMNLEFAWQPRYHDHIIRTEGEFLRIRNYIADNPKKWKK